jgi:hypothetical protein
MAQLSVPIIFSRIDSHEQLIAAFVDQKSVGPNDTVQLLIDFDVHSVFCDHLAIIVAYVRSLDEMGIRYYITFRNLMATSAPVQYAARIGFFRLLGYEMPVSGKQMSSVCKCSDIIWHDDAIPARETSEYVLGKITDNRSLDPSLVELMHYTLKELVDNVLTLPLSPVDRFVVSQYAPFRGEVRMLVCNTSRGLFNMLTDTSGNPKRCLEGNTALNRVADFAVANKGELFIHSGPDAIHISDGKTTVQKVCDWHGSYVFLKIKTQQPADYKEILARYAVQFDNYERDNKKQHTAQHVLALSDH